MTQHHASRLPADTSESGWTAIAKRDFPMRTLDGKLLADWIIVGAGFGGLSAARRLLQIDPGARIVVLDAQRVAQGASGRNSGFMIDVPHNISSGDYSIGGADSSRLEMKQNRQAIAFAAEVARECGMGLETFDPCGKINAAATARGLKINHRFMTSLRQIGEACQELDAAQMREITGSDYYLGGIHSPGTVLIQPASYILGLAASLSRQVQILEDSPVTDLKRNGDSWTAISPKGSVQAPKVILAVNGHVESFGFFRHRLIHVFTYASMTAPLPASAQTAPSAGAAKWAILPADPMGATLRRITDGAQARIVIRTHFTYDPTIQLSPRRLSRIVAHQRRSFDARFPRLAGIPFDYSWGGALCLSTNHVPAFGELDEGLYSACGDNGLGTVKSTLAGMMAAELATGTATPELAEYRRQPEPARLPPGLIANLGINSVIQYHQLRAGREG